jgi:hypothetical protein
VATEKVSYSDISNFTNIQRAYLETMSFKEKEENVSEPH